MPVTNFKPTHRIVEFHEDDAFAKWPDENIKPGVVGTWEPEGPSKGRPGFEVGRFDPGDGYGHCFFLGVKVVPISEH
ncbi:MAG: hypothetical protein ACWGQW_00245 [bacterium]